MKATIVAYIVDLSDQDSRMREGSCCVRQTWFSGENSLREVLAGTYIHRKGEVETDDHKVVRNQKRG